MLDIFANNKDFFNYYLGEYPKRFTENCFSSFLYYVVQEHKKSNPNIKWDKNELNLIRAETLRSNENAIQYLFNNCDEIGRLYPNHIQQTAYHVNEPSGFPFGYRKTEVAICREVSFTPVAPRYIPSKMMSAIDNYHNVWSGRDPFEREALLHILIVQIQPFEDGNKRTAQLLTSFNLLKEGFAPIIINDQDKETYLNFIDKCDIEGFAKFLRNNSMGELEHIYELYNWFENEKPYAKGVAAK